MMEMMEMMVVREAVGSVGEDDDGGEVMRGDGETRRGILPWRPF
jgi:hypothetical protein